MSSFVPIRERSSRKYEVCTRKELLMFQCLMKGESEGKGLAFLRYMEFVPPLREVGSAVRCVFLQ